MPEPCLPSGLSRGLWLMVTPISIPGRPWKAVSLSNDFSLVKDIVSVLLVGDPAGWRSRGAGLWCPPSRTWLLQVRPASGSLACDRGQCTEWRLAILLCYAAVEMFKMPYVYMGGQKETFHVGLAASVSTWLSSHLFAIWFG